MEEIGKSIESIEEVKEPSGPDFKPKVKDQGQQLDDEDDFFENSIEEADQAMAPVDELRDSFDESVSLNSSGVSSEQNSIEKMADEFGEDELEMEADQVLPDELADKKFDQEMSKNDVSQATKVTNAMREDEFDSDGSFDIASSGIDTDDEEQMSMGYQEVGHEEEEKKEEVLDSESDRELEIADQKAPVEEKEESQDDEDELDR